MTVEELAGMTLGDALRAQAQMRPDAPALWGDTRALTWGQLDAEVDQLAGLLTHMGVRKGDAVGFLITKRPEAPAPARRAARAAPSRCAGARAPGVARRRGRDRAARR